MVGRAVSGSETRSKENRLAALAAFSLRWIKLSARLVVSESRHFFY